VPPARGRDPQGDLVSALSVAKDRRAAEIRRVQDSMADLQRELDHGVHGHNGVLDPYLQERARVLAAERERLASTVTELEGLGPDALVLRFVPEAKPVEVVNLEEALRGQNVPRQVVVNKDVPRLTRREGGDPGPGQPMSGALSNWTPGQVHTPDYSAYR
jgi:hypothetical protein